MCVGSLHLARVYVRQTQSSASSDKHKLAGTKIRRQEVMQCLLHQHGDLELHTLADWKPMKLLQDVRNVLAPTRVSDEVCCAVLN